MKLKSEDKKEKGGFFDNILGLGKTRSKGNNNKKK